MNNLATVIGFTMKNKFKSKTFIVTSLIFVLILTLGLNAPYVISQFNINSVMKIGMVQQHETDIPLKLQAWYAQQEVPDFEVILFPDKGSAEANEQWAKQQIAAGEMDGYLEMGESDETGFPKLVYKSMEILDYYLMNKLQSALHQIKTEMVVENLGLSQAEIAKINSPVSLERVQISVTEGAGDIEGGKSEEEIVLASVLVYALIILLFIAVMVSGQLIASEITAEKSSRIMELLVTSVSPLTQMFGKIIGMFLVGLSQIVLLVVVTFFNMSFSHNKHAFAQIDLDFGLMDPMLIVYALIFYLLGYLLYATLFAAVGSIVSRTEDLGQAVMPISILSMIGYFIAILGIQSPTSPIIVFTSFVPFFTPFIMFLRMGTTDPAMWEVWLSIGLLLASILLFGWLSAKIYRTGVLMYGKRPSWKELRKAMKAYKI